MIVEVINVLLLLTSAAFGTQGAEYHLLRDTSLTTTAVKTPWQGFTTSAIPCALVCEQMEDCHSFTYNRRTHLCIPGSWVTSATSDLVGWKGDLYTKSLCRTNADFTVLYDNGTGSCIFLSERGKNYEDAATSCTANHAHLMTIKSTRKKQLVDDLLYSNDVGSLWVGLDARRVDEVYEWIDDGSVIATDLKNAFFAPHEPDSWHNDEDCVEITSGYRENMLYDDLCSSSIRRYLCET